ncbi:flavodoxin family protein [Methanohalophilus halophilus]|uniref:Flavodoxin n=1 Tax=Methanohalophilus halophilus TaxID=2177 RepID=A0A1L3Q3T4_9EURY|nr:flavodoxin family protein [Methanohalophilus halophilus]APH39441.1 flavodoxin [Methanohalophilus halophilus]RNI07730.1 flavodoxin [Methanohalophilus halophilus]SDW97895.1 Flavodoxin [Methanohalophilus halophilus]
MKVLVTYITRTGNTKKVAEAIYDEIDEQKEMKPLDEVNSLDGYDLTFIGFPINQLYPPEKAQKFLNNQTSGRDSALFMTHGVPEGTGLILDWISTAKEMASGANIIDIFNCQGKVARKVLDILQNSDDPEMRAFANMCVLAKEQPDRIRLQKAREFARSIVSQKKGYIAP